MYVHEKTRHKIQLDAAAKSVRKASDINIQFTEAVAHHTAPGAPAKFTLHEERGSKDTVNWWKWSAVESHLKKKKNRKKENSCL